MHLRKLCVVYSLVIHITCADYKYRELMRVERDKIEKTSNSSAWLVGKYESQAIRFSQS